MRIAAGSIPLIGPTTSLPPLAPWSNFSVRTRFDATGSLQLPSPAREKELLRSAWEHRDAFKCDARNQLFADYIERSLSIIVATHTGTDRLISNGGRRGSRQTNSWREAQLQVRKRVVHTRDSIA
jgi:hypothetical protein